MKHQMRSTNEKIFPILTPNEQREIYPILKLTEEHERKIYAQSFFESYAPQPNPNTNNKYIELN